MNYSNVNLFHDRARALFGKDPQKKIEKETGIPQGTISKIINGMGKPQVDTVVKIAMHYNVNIYWLLGIPGAHRTVGEVTPGIREECDTYGLSDQAVRSLRELKGSKTARGIDYLLSNHSFTEDRSENASLLEVIANYCADVMVVSNDTEDIRCSLNAAGTFSVDGKSIQTPLQYGEISFSLSEVILEKQLQDIERRLRALKDLKIKAKNYHNRVKEFPDETNT